MLKSKLIDLFCTMTQYVKGKKCMWASLWEEFVSLGRDRRESSQNRSWHCSLLSCRNGWRLQTAGRSCSATWRSRCLRSSAWRRSTAPRRRRSSCRADSSIPWSVSCLERILRRVWRSSSRPAPPPSSVDVSSKRERLSTPAGLNRASDLLWWICYDSNDNIRYD